MSSGSAVVMIVMMTKVMGAVMLGGEVADGAPGTHRLSQNVTM